MANTLNVCKTGLICRYTLCSRHYDFDYCNVPGSLVVVVTWHLFCSEQCMVFMFPGNPQFQNDITYTFMCNLLQLDKFQWINSFLLRKSVPVQITTMISQRNFPDSMVHGASMGPTWGRQDPGGPHVGPMNFAIWVINHSVFIPVSTIKHVSKYSNTLQPWLWYVMWSIDTCFQNDGGPRWFHLYSAHGDLHILANILQTIFTYTFHWKKSILFEFHHRSQTDMKSSFD